MFDRRRSERFAEMVEEAVGRRHRHRRTDIDGDLAPLVRLAQRMAADADCAKAGMCVDAALGKGANQAATTSATRAIVANDAT